MDFELSPEQREIQALARDFGAEKIEPYASEWDREHRFPRDLFGELAELGLMGVCVPEEYGGAGASPVRSSGSRTRATLARFSSSPGPTPRRRAPAALAPSSSTATTSA